MTTGPSMDTRITSLRWSQPSYQLTTPTTSKTQATPLQFSKADKTDGFYPGLTLSNKTTDPLAAETGVVKSSYTSDPLEVVSAELGPSGFKPFHNRDLAIERISSCALLAKYMANSVARESITKSVNDFDLHYGDIRNQEYNV